MKISAEKLQEIIESHGRWLRNAEGGERADLSDAYLSDAYLSGANLGGADLSDADLDKTYYQVVRIGSRRGTTTYCVDDDNVLCGCWNGFKGGTLEEFKTRVESYTDVKVIILTSNITMSIWRQSHSLRQ